LIFKGLNDEFTDEVVAAGIVTVGQTNPGSCSTSLRMPPANVELEGVVEIPTMLAGK
jgi:hypothetical protein